jgi:hypothetical protein
LEALTKVAFIPFGVKRKPSPCWVNLPRCSRFCPFSAQTKNTSSPTHLRRKAISGWPARGGIGGGLWASGVLEEGSSVCGRGLADVLGAGAVEAVEIIGFSRTTFT